MDINSRVMKEKLPIISAGLIGLSLLINNFVVIKKRGEERNKQP